MGWLMNTLILTQACLTLSALQFNNGRSYMGNLGAPIGYHNIGELPQAQKFLQKLDHFTSSDISTWEQRYFVNNSYFDINNPGPIFLMIGGEGPADPRWMVKGAWIEYAERYGALCIMLEHRYYGQSHPTKDISVKNLKYLSSQQALADLAYFISAKNEEYKFNSTIKWIAFGGSYPGSLAAWLRMKYPHLVYAAISSSGPLIARVNFEEYFQVVVAALREKTGSSTCGDIVKDAHAEIHMLMHSNPSLLENKFRVCQPFVSASQDDIRNFYNSIANDFADLVQYNEDKRIGGDGRYQNLTINTVCDIMTAPGEQLAYERLALFNSKMLEKANQTCLDYSYRNMIKLLTNTDWKDGEGGRQWFYQTCTEFGFFQTSSAVVDEFGDYFTVDFFEKQCQDVFGVKFNSAYIERAAHWTNEVYGALDIVVSRVLFVHGSVDPWHALGIIHSKDTNAPAIYIQGSAHCADMYPSFETDSEQLKDARLQIKEYLNAWTDY